ncbi:MAG TPA: hypothetical protein VKR58_00735, partial [Aquella sp.]|nr:hypothetical protein [Aquella sp.]
GFSYFASFWDLAVPVAGEVAKQIVEDSCPSGEDRVRDELRLEFNTRIDEVSKRVDELSGRLDAEGYYSKEMRSELIDLHLRELIDKFDAELSKFDGIYGNYKSFLMGSGYNFLSDFTENAVSEDQIPKFKGWFLSNSDFEDLFINTEPQLSAFTDILGGKSFGTLHSVIEGKCRDVTWMAGDALRFRDQCDNLVMYVTSNVASRALKAKEMLDDEIKTVSDANLDDNWYKTKRGMAMQYFTYKTDKYYNIDWKDASAIVTKIIDSHLNEIQDTLIGKKVNANGDISYGNNIYDRFEGFPKELLASKDKVECKYKILEWYPDSVDNKPYVITNCNYSYGTSDRTKSKYYLPKNYLENKAEDLKVKNVLGVLVPINAKQIKTQIISMPAEVIGLSSTGSRNGIARFKSGGISTKALFDLVSELPLKINSMSIPHYDKIFEIKDPTKIKEIKLVDDFTFVQSKNYDPINPAYSFLGNPRVRLEIQPSTLLAPVKAADGKSKVHFHSEVWNVVNRIKAMVDSDAYELDAPVYLSFEKNGYTYVFGLGIRNIGGRYFCTYNWDMSVDTDDCSFSRDSFKPLEEVGLVCLTDTQCKAEGKQIIWNDGTYAEISGTGNNIHLSYGSKK